MNKSRIFLGATGFLLTFVGIYASKAARTAKKLLGYTRSGSGCHYVRQFTQVTRFGAFDEGVTVKTGTSNKTVFTRGVPVSPDWCSYT